MAMVNLGNISAVTTQMLGSDIGGVVATGVSTLLQSGGSDSLAGALSQLEKFFSPDSATRLGNTALASGPMAFSGLAAAVGAGQATTLGNPFGATQGLQPKMQGMIEGLNQTLDDMLQKMGQLSPGQQQFARTGTATTTADAARQFEMVMDQAMKLHLSGNAGDGIKAQALFQQALGMLSMPATAAEAGGRASAITGGGGFGAPVGASGFGGFGAGATAPANTFGGSGFTSAGGGTGASIAGGVGGGGGLDAMMSQAESLLRSDSMEAQLAGQRLMQKALRMFELISKLIEKQSEMASKAIAAIK